MADAPLSPEEIEHRGFSSSFRGFDANEVRAYLGRVADELRAAAAEQRELQRRLADAEHRAAHPVLDHATLSRAVGDEMARVLASAQEAGQELRAKAEDNVGRMLREAHEHAQRIRSEADAVLAARSDETQEAVAQVRAQAETEAGAIAAKARSDAGAVVEAGEASARRLMQEAEAARAQVLGDLGRRRRMINVQVEQLRAGRDRLLDAYRVVRRTLDEVSDELERVEVEAKAAAGEAARRLAVARPGGPIEAAPFPEVGAGPDSAVTEREGDAAVVEPPVLAPPRGPTAPPPVQRPAAPQRTRVAPLDVVEAPAEIEAVRVLETVAMPADPEPADPASVVDDLFARIRADRAASVARAEAVLASEPTPVAPADETVAEDATAGPDGTADGPDDEALRERRDAAVEAIWSRLARSLKRALQDEQNETLDRLRAGRSQPTGAELVPGDQQAARFAKVAIVVLGEAAHEGAKFVSAGALPSVKVDDLAADLAGSLAGPLRRALDDCVRASGDDRATLVERIGGAYRECRGQRVERVAIDATVAAFGRGTLAAAGGQTLRWIVEDEAGPCSDCDDNALAGPTAAGDAYPTGQTHPPAHDGCRCFLAPAP